MIPIAITAEAYEAIAATLADVFSRHPDQDTAAKFRTARSQAFAAWAEVTGATMAA